MSYDLPVYPDFNDVLGTLVAGAFPEIGDHWGTDLNDVEGELPWFHVGHVPSSGGRLNTTATVDWEIFAPTYAAASLLARRISAFLLGYPHSVEVDERLVVIDTVVETRSPAELPWDDSNVRRFASTVLLSVRR